MGRCNSLGSWKSFLWYEPQLIRASILFFPILCPFRALLWVGGSGWWLDGLSILSLLIRQAIFFILISYSRSFKDWNPLYFREELIIPTVFPFSKRFCHILKLGRSVWHFSMDYHHHNFMVPSIEALISNMYFFKKGVIEFVTILFLFYVFDFWPRGMWDLSSPTRDGIPCIRKWSLNPWAAKEVPHVLFKLLIPSNQQLINTLWS